ncbi:predicted protein [Aspergillus nidulans FGSC A4]|nr:predicted protein [Aspergillus nidulans FGSC A4]|eukprot:XP_662850.1 predicted protein [Aspergillus nidulans FGSC A4]
MYFQDLLNIVMPLTVMRTMPPYPTLSYMQAYMDKTSIVNSRPGSNYSSLPVDLISYSKQGWHNADSYLLILLYMLKAAAAKQGLWVGKAADQELAWLFNDKGLKVHYNTMHHNIFIKDSLVVFVTAYYKGFYASNNVKIIYQYLPCEVGKLVVYCQFLCILSIFLNNIQAKYKQVMAALEADKDLNKIVLGKHTNLGAGTSTEAPGGCIIMALGILYML